MVAHRRIRFGVSGFGVQVSGIRKVSCLGFRVEIGTVRWWSTKAFDSDFGVQVSGIRKV